MNDFVLPELKQIIGAMLFVRKEPLTVAEIRRVLAATAERRGGITSDFAKANEAQVREAKAAERARRRANPVEHPVALPANIKSEIARYLRLEYGERP